MLTDAQKLGRRVEKRRKEHKWTQQHLCDQIGMTLSALRAIEFGRSEPKTPTLRKLCIALGVTSDYLLFGVNRHKKQDPTEEAAA